jgi:hypothetical protein
VIHSNDPLTHPLIINVLSSSPLLRLLSLSLIDLKLEDPSRPSFASDSGSPSLSILSPLGLFTQSYLSAGAKRGG